ncbi:unnamed protein product [Pleuronectes platessa]|uniref:Uncharacterized protein n=1 Tax=Pleuronectes platessa TaxID=8262 RepID=A0A9N7YQ79_PLEPL|nr:unnamed protein product [Pleuronectes platessa]
MDNKRPLNPSAESSGCFSSVRDVGQHAFISLAAGIVEKSNQATGDDSAHREMLGRVPRVCVRARKCGRKAPLVTSQTGKACSICLTAGHAIRCQDSKDPTHSLKNTAPRPTHPTPHPLSAPPSPSDGALLPPVPSSILISCPSPSPLAPSVKMCDMSSTSLIYPLISPAPPLLPSEPPPLPFPPRNMSRRQEDLRLGGTDRLVGGFSLPAAFEQYSQECLLLNRHHIPPPQVARGNPTSPNTRRRERALAEKERMKRKREKERKRGRENKGPGQREGGGSYDRGGLWLTSGAEPQKVCVAEREEADQTAQAH